MNGEPHTHARDLRFVKMHGLGNDFVVVDARGAPARMNARLAHALGDRHRGIGFDQLAVIHEGEGATAEVEFWNADGSLTGACGNATRCVGHLLIEESKAPEVTMKTVNGLLRGWRNQDGTLTVDMGSAQLGWREIPLAGEVDTVSLPLEGAPGAVSMGNPHCVFFVEDADSVALEEAGPVWEHHPTFPERTNVEFCQVLDRHSIRMRVWERGTGVTLACGSGACAAVVAGVRKGLVEREVRVILDGGPLDLEWRENGHVLMTGPVATVFEGRLTTEFLAGVRP